MCWKLFYSALYKTPVRKETGDSLVIEYPDKETESKKISIIPPVQEVNLIPIVCHHKVYYIFNCRMQ